MHFDQILFAKYLKDDAKGETIFLCVEGYLKKHNISLVNITAVATDSALAMVGCHR